MPSAQNWQKPEGIQVHPSLVWRSLTRSDLHGRGEPKSQTSEVEIRPSDSSIHKHLNIGTGVQKNGSYLGVAEGSLLKGWRVVLKVMVWTPKSLDVNIIKYI